MKEMGYEYGRKEVENGICEFCNCNGNLKPADYIKLQLHINPFAYVFFLQFFVAN